MASDTSSRPYQPTVEEYNSDESDGHVLSANFPRKASPAAQANVSTKRSKDLQTDKAPASNDTAHTKPADVRSDSGYSSYTAASKSSADSAQRHPSPPPAPPKVASSPAPKRRPTVSDPRHQSTKSSPRPKVSRTASVSSKQRPSTTRRPTITREPDMAQEECRDPNCTSCGPNVRPNRRSVAEPFPSASAQHFANLPSDQVSQRSDPNPYYNPPSPTYSRNPYSQQPGVFIQPSQPHSRRRSSSTVRPRPQSYAGGDPNAGYWAPQPNYGYPSPPQERGPPPAMYQSMPYPYSQQSGNYYSGSANTSPPEYQRPGFSARGSSYTARGNLLPPVITQAQDDNANYSARYGAQPPTPVEAQPRAPRQRRIMPPAQDPNEYSSSEESDSEYYDEEELRRSRAPARALMPPPPLPEKPRAKSKKRRPTLSHSSTTPVADLREHRKSFIVAERPKVQQPRERERDRLPRQQTEPVRRQSVSRPPLHREAQSEYATRQIHTIVNNSRSNRRQSYQAPARDYEKLYHEKAYIQHEKAAKAAILQQRQLALEAERHEALLEAQRQQALEAQFREQQKRERRKSRVIETHGMPGQFLDDEEEEQRPLRPRRKTESESRKGKERIPETSRREMDAEEYINSTRGLRAPLADSLTKAAKRASRIPSGHSESGSSGSGGQSISQRTNKTNGNEIRLRVDASAPLALSFNGDMEGRTLQLLPAENGMTDVVIGHRDETYQGEQDIVSQSNRRSIMGPPPRRGGEDLISERSGRSSRSRREREERDERGHVLRRVRQTNYHER